MLHAGRQHMGLKALEDAGVLVGSADSASQLPHLTTPKHRLGCLTNCCSFFAAQSLQSTDPACARILLDSNQSGSPCINKAFVSLTSERRGYTLSLPVVQVSHAGDALADEAAIEGGFAGLVVDLFSAGAAIEPLNHVNHPPSIIHILFQTLAEG